MAKVSRSEAKRLAAEVSEPRLVVPLPTGVAAFLDEYRPAGVGDVEWAAIWDVHREVMNRAGFVTKATLDKYVAVVAGFLVWCHQRHLPLVIESVFTRDTIDAFYVGGMTAHKHATRNDYRSRLHGLAPKVNPTLVAPTVFATDGYQHVRPGYTETEEAMIRRVALRQRRPLTRRQVCAVVGFGAGAGLDGKDLRSLRAQDVTVSDDGIEVQVTGPRPRVTVVRHDYEQLVLIGIETLHPASLVLGRDIDRKSITSNILGRADVFDDAPKIEVSRLRSTWLMSLMRRSVPIQVILDAAGLQTARSLTDLVPHLAPLEPGDNHDWLRGGAA
jgi:hypothetical protein